MTTVTDDVPPGSMFPPATAAGVGEPTPAGPAAKKTGRRRDTTPAPAKKAGRPSNADRLQSKVAELYGSLALIVMFSDPELAARIAEHADEMAAAWIKLADEYPSVAKLLDRLTTTSAIGMFAAVHFRVFGPKLVDKLGGMFGAGTQGEPEGAPDAGAQVFPGPWPEPNGA